MKLQNVAISSDGSDKKKKTNKQKKPTDALILCETVSPSSLLTC